MTTTLSEAFCQGLYVAKVPFGWVVRTGFRRTGGDAIGFYIIGPDEKERYRLEDDGGTLPGLQAAGADLRNEVRARVFSDLLNEYGVLYDEGSATLRTENLGVEDVLDKVLSFVTLLLRVQDLAFMTREKVASTFFEDLHQAILQPRHGRPEILPPASKQERRG